MLIASNQLAALTVESMPYLAASMPVAMRSSRPPRPFEFVRLRVKPAAVIPPKAEVSADPTATPLIDDRPAVALPPGMTGSVNASGPTDAAQNPAGAPAGNPTGPGPAPGGPSPSPTPANPEDLLPVVRPSAPSRNPELDLLLPFFVPPAAPTGSRATFRQT